jgi:hypothetical protein
MAVFSRYNPRGVGRGSVLLQAHPNAEPVPWKPHATVTRTDPNWGGAGRVHRVGPHERAGLFKPTNLGERKLRFERRRGGSFDELGMRRRLWRLWRMPRDAARERREQGSKVIPCN